MKFLPETGFNILIVGRWNPSVFSPEWIRSNVIDSEISLAIPVGDIDAPPRISVSNVHLFPARNLLDARPTEMDEGAFQSVGSVASKIVGLLPHTPLNASGINIRFVEDTSLDNLLRDFQFDDAGKISHTKYALLKSKISRSFSLADGGILNLSLNHEANSVIVEFNFHTLSTDAATIQSKLAPENIAARVEEAKAFMYETYDLTLES